MLISMDPVKKAPTIVCLLSASSTFLGTVLFLNVLMRHAAAIFHGSTEYNDTEYLLISSIYFGVYYLAFVNANWVERSMRDKPVMNHMKLTVMYLAVAGMSYYL